MGFRRDFNIGKKGEKLVYDILTAHGLILLYNTSKEKREHFDLSLEINGKTYLIEVKADKRALLTKNLACEYFNSRTNKPSGLFATKSEIWAVILGDAVWFAKVDKLKKFVNTVKPERIVIGAGDGNADIMLYKLDLILPAVFIRVDNLGKDELINFITGE